MSNRVFAYSSVADIAANGVWLDRLAHMEELNYRGVLTYTRLVQIGATPHLIVIVGEVPLETARRVANSVVWSGESPPVAGAQ